MGDAVAVHPKALGYAVLLVEESALGAQELRNRRGVKAPNFLVVCNIVNTMPMLSKCGAGGKKQVS